MTRLRDAVCADLGFHGANSGHSTHAWHPFPAKFPPQLPQFFIERLTEVNDVVLDPMFGSGTTLSEAVRLQRRTIGCDIDPLARLIASAKLTPVNAMSALRTGCEITDIARRNFLEDRDRLEKDLTSRFDDKTRAFIDYWFLPQQQLELIALLRVIEALPQERYRLFFQMIFSSTIIAKSGGVSRARDLAHTRPHRVEEKTPVSAFTEFPKRLKSALSSQLDVVANQDARVMARSANNTDLPSSSIDLIVTSPPYANNAIDYMRAHKFSLVWFGWKIDELSGIRAKYLGHDAGASDQFINLPSQCERKISMLSKLDPKKASALRRYFGEMSAVISEMRRVLKRRKAAIIVVGTSNLRGVDVETHKCLASIGESVGFRLAGVGVRHLDRDKRMMPARWGNERKSQIENRMHEEYVIGFLKR